MTTWNAPHTFPCPKCGRLASVLGSRLRLWLGLRTRVCGGCAEKGNHGHR